MTSKGISVILVIAFSYLMIMLAPSILANISYAQLHNSSTTSTPQPSSTLPDGAVTITSPQDGQKVPVGQDLEVTGTSMANAASDCKITVNLNSVKPYQAAVAAGPGGANDYSQWSITLTSKYTSIEEGQNRIAAKMSCSNDPNLKQFAHVNVTGVASSSFSSPPPSVSDMGPPQSSPPQSNPQIQSTVPASPSSSTLPDNAVTITSPTQDKSYSFSSYGKTSDIYRGDGIQGGVTIPKGSSSSSIQTTSNNNNNNIASNYDDKTNGGNNLTGNDNKVVMINFDDGYKSHFLYAKPILDKYGFKATFFIVCGKMETNPKWMTWQDITALKDDGMDIQSHTMTHAHLDSVSAEKLDYEIGYAKQCLADHGFDTTIFAYPKNLGSDNNTVVNVVSKYYDLARSGTEPLFFLDCTGYKRYPQTDCSTDSADGSLNYANRYDIKNASPYHFSGNINLDESQMFDKFVQLVNRQTAFNSNGSINAIPIISYHNLTNNMEDYNSMATTLTVSLFAQEMKYLHDNGFKVLLLNQLGYDTKHNAFYLKNSADDDNTAATTNTALRASTITTALEKSTSVN
jgi:peptidoglycan/xylan/chitin deacetylase (PgdA/CDA1 family)